MAEKTARLATRIDTKVDERLRLLAHVRRQRMGRVLSELLDRALPSAVELTEQISNGGGADERS